MNSIVIIGGGGFIGINLLNQLTSNLGRRYEKIIVIDKSLDHLLLYNITIQKGLEFVKSDCLSLSPEVLLKISKCEIIIFLAGMTDVKTSIKYPSRTFEYNTKIILNLLDHLRSKKTAIKQFVFASTGGALFGYDGGIICDESAIPKPLSSYGISKLASEHLINSYGKSIGFKVVVCRFGNVFGPYSLHKTSLIHAAIRAVIRKEILTVYGTGEVTRDFVSVELVCSAIEFLIDDNETGIFNISSGSSTSVNEVLSHIEELAQSEILISRVPPVKGEVKAVELDNSKLRNRFPLLLKKFNSLEIDILTTFNWYRRFLK